MTTNKVNKTIKESKVKYSNKDLTEDFLDKYKTLEELVSRKFKLASSASPIAYLEKRKEFASYEVRLAYCREIRNFLQHEPKVDGDFAVTPSKQMINVLEELIELVKNPPRCYDVAIKLENIYYRSLEDNVLKSIKEMSHGKYSHIPILKDGVVVGVFSKSSLFNYVVKNNKFIDDTLCFKDIKEYICLKCDGSEHYRFCKYDEKVEDVKKLFEDNYKNDNRISIVFLTKNGNKSEKLEGMVTLYDILKEQK